MATSVALNVTEPTCCGIGGSVNGTYIPLAILIFSHSDAFCLFYDAKSKTVKALNGSGRSPEKLTIDHLRKQGVMGKKIPLLNLNSVTIPGAFLKYCTFRHVPKTIQVLPRPGWTRWRSSAVAHFLLARYLLLLSGWQKKGGSLVSLL